MLSEGAAGGLPGNCLCGGSRAIDGPVETIGGQIDRLLPEGGHREQARQAYDAGIVAGFYGGESALAWRGDSRVRGRSGLPRRCTDCGGGCMDMDIRKVISSDN